MSGPSRVSVRTDFRIQGVIGTKAQSQCLIREHEQKYEQEQEHQHKHSIFASHRFFDLALSRIASLWKYHFFQKMTLLRGYNGQVATIRSKGGPAR
ncbi:unnamed protein product [Fusarium graminearum]|uniref:Chromosome 4, complete genome n=2 Tax=Gibberella zeae TaxID=5518 RepID=A0A098DUU8_GIBZE|nr:unnamed protein product [Fusarium graminearum]CAF3465235.1 unnamed protein product [Fusarium graminearum]CAF3609036.1 unnamed protein product [Fusarium graminearum]CAG1971426.1 unnamed protein product [Fusarium graminearum]CAG1977529.1 unnamed protein product [Fusarium graminearum]